MGKDDQLAYAYSILDRAVSLHKPKYAVAYNYDDLAMEYGFPGPAMHGVMYIKVKKVDQLPQGQDPEGFLAHRHRCLAGVWIQAPATSGLRSQFASRDGTRTPLVAPGKESNR